MTPRIDGLVAVWKTYLPENRARMLGWLDEKEAAELLKALKVKDLGGLLAEIRKRYE